MSHPQYIPNTPCEDDVLANKPHESVAATLKLVITDPKYNLKSKVIGLEGEWGSGKSTVINILNKKLKEGKPEKTYHTYTFDVWGHQEDLTRRSFLEEIIAELRAEGLLTKDDKYWDDEVNKLTAKTVITNTETFPKVKLYVLWLVLFPIWTLFCENAGHILINMGLPIPSWMGWIKEFGWLVLAILLLCGLYRSYKEIKKDEIEKKRKEAEEAKKKEENYEEENNSSKSRNPVSKFRKWAPKFWERVSKMLYIFQGEELESKQKDNIIEDEPSVKRFRDIFKRIADDINVAGLIIVFDNMDRVASKEKLMSIWSSIYTFFVDSKELNIDPKKEVWVIIPYDRVHLGKFFKDDGGKDDEIIREFISKTFSTSFSVPTPVLSAWNEYLAKKLNEAFGGLITDKDCSMLASLLRLSTDVSKIKPREMVSYVNNLVSLYIQHKDKNIDIPYLALYERKRHKIALDPLKEILGDECFNKEVSFFASKEELVTNISALFYNVPTEMATEVLMKNDVERLIYAYDDKNFEVLSVHSAFAKYVYELFFDDDFIPTKYDVKDLSAFVVRVKDHINGHQAKGCWEKLKQAIANSANQDSLTGVQEWHKELIRNAPLGIANALVDRMLHIVYNNANTGGGGKAYYATLVGLYLEGEKSEKKLVISPRSITLQPSDFVEYYQLLEKYKLQAMYRPFLITMDEGQLTEYMLTINRTNYKQGMLKLLPMVGWLVGEGFVFTSLKEVNDGFFTDLDDSNTVEQVDIVLMLNRVLGMEELEIPSNINSIYQSTRCEESFPDVAACIIKSAKGSSVKAKRYADLLSKDEVPGLDLVIQRYISYGDMMKLLVEEVDSTLVQNLVKRLTNESREKSPDIGWVFENLDGVEDCIFGNEICGFVAEFDKWSSLFERFVNSTNILNKGQVSSRWFNLVGEKYNEYGVLRYVVSSSIAYLENSDTKVWEENFFQETTFWKAFEKLFELKLVDSILKKENLLKGYEEYLKKLVKGEISEPDIDLLQKITASLHQGRVKTIADAVYNETRNISRIEEDDSFEFFIPFFVRHSNNFNKKEQRDNVYTKFIRELGRSKYLVLALLSGDDRDKLLVLVVNLEDKTELANTFNEWVNDEECSEEEKVLLEKFINDANLQITESIETEEVEDVVAGSEQN